MPLCYLNHFLQLCAIPPQHPPPQPYLWPLPPAAALLNNAITLSDNRHFPRKQCASICRQTMPWDRERDRANRVQLAASGNLEGSLIRLIWTIPYTPYHTIPANLNGQHLNYPQLTSATSPNPHHIYSNSNTFKFLWDHLQIVGDIWQWIWRVFIHL